MAIDVSEPSIDAFAPVAPPTTPEQNLDTVEMTINMGPQHPSTHGVFRMVLQLAGERVQAVEPFIGYLHRGAEKLGEAGDVEGYRKAVIWLDRTDYLSVWPNEHCYMLCLEKLAGIEVPERAEYLRVILSELGRVNSHCMFYGAFGADAGATTPFMYAFALREELYSIFEAVGGARMFPNYFRPGGLREDVPTDFVQRATKTVDTAYRDCDEFEALLTTNEIFLSRTRGIGVITPERALDLGLSGPVLRATGIPLDIRRVEPYSIYDRFEFDVPVGTRGDCYERYLIRLQEMRQSLYIVEQALRDLPGGPIMGNAPKALRPPRGDAYQRIENARGDFGVYLVSDGRSPAPYRVKYRSPCFVNLQGLNEMVVGAYVADAVLALGSIDIVLGEVDR
ncbi:MAG TPA: NADH-quinone oxidoreductase subunit D [Chloroflexota bacterium]|nr:NADH-quinone oxidoreductase subunit D [Chloroflexota bacterium]